VGVASHNEAMEVVRYGHTSNEPIVILTVCLALPSALGRGAMRDKAEGEDRMIRHHALGAITILCSIAFNSPAFSDDAVCGPAPALPTTAESSESLKGQLQGQADFLSKLVGKAELDGQIEAARRNIYQNSDGFFAAQKDAYLAFVFCSVVISDRTLSTLEKIDAIKKYRETPIPNKSGAIDQSVSKFALLQKYKDVLKQINESVMLRRAIVIPALDQYIESPTLDNWQAVLWGVRRLQLQIDSAVMMAMEYDSTFFQQNALLVQFADFIDNDTPQVKNIRHVVFGHATAIWSQNGQSIAQITVAQTAPPVDQARAWNTAFANRAERLQVELIRLIGMLNDSN
jgi:hypothetical protein